MLSLPIRVLVVEPDYNLIERIVSHLEGAGASVCACDTLTEAKKQLPVFLPDIILCEVQLTDGSGFDLHALVTQSSVATVFFSEESKVRNVVEALRVGVSDFILKPLDDFDVILRVLEKAWRISKLQEEQERDRASLKRLNKELTHHLKALEHDQAAGRLVQKRFMPHSPAELGGINISYSVEPSEHLSGDTIDFGLFAERYLAFYLLDVSGHGAASAFVAVWVKQIVRGFFKGLGRQRSATRLERHIPALLSHINEQLIESGVGKHLTCFVGMIDIETNAFSYVVAGHLPLPILMSDNGAEYIPGGGKPVGIFPGVEWVLQSMALPKTCSLLVCSDGVLDVLAAGDLSEKEAYLLSRLRSKNPESVDDIKAEIMDESEKTLVDDVALLLLKCDN
jgi:serine phosphatase RsbU (regulator of sigma subunit)